MHKSTDWPSVGYLGIIYFSSWFIAWFYRILIAYVAITRSQDGVIVLVMILLDARCL